RGENVFAEPVGQLDQAVLAEAPVRSIEQLVEDLAVVEIGRLVDGRQGEPLQDAPQCAEDGAAVEDVVGICVRHVGRDQRAVHVEEGAAVPPWLRLRLWLDLHGRSYAMASAP